MLEIRFTEKAIIDVEVFIRNYKESFLRLYGDTGIWSEAVIKNIYIKSADELREEIINGIVGKLNKDRVLGRKEHDAMTEIDFYVGSRLIVVIFSDKHELGERWIESIFIDRKPIIF